MTVGHVAAHVGHVDVSVRVLGVRLGLAGEYASLEAACTTVLLSRDNHLCPPSEAGCPAEPSAFLETYDPRFGSPRRENTRR